MKSIPDSPQIDETGVDGPVLIAGEAGDLPSLAPRPLLISLGPDAYRVYTPGREVELGDIKYEYRGRFKSKRWHGYPNGFACWLPGYANPENAARDLYTGWLKWSESGE
jgi:hypothetical protein